MAGISDLFGDLFEADWFPEVVLLMKFELLLGTVWTDITSYVYQRTQVTISRGRPDESSNGTSNPSSITFQLNNRLGTFSPKNPTGPFYGLIGRNTQFRVSVQNTATYPTTMGYRFWGEISEWPPSWDQTGLDVYVSITASGILRRLNQNAPLRSALYRYYKQLATPPLAYWPAEDGSTSGSLSSGIAGGFPMTFTGAPELASDSGLAAAAAFASMNGAIFTGPTGVAGALPVASTAVLSGSGNWKAPAGVTAILVQAWGAGGGGSDYNGVQGGAGAGGAEFATGSLAVTAGDSYAYSVGASSVAVNGGDTTMHGDSSTSIVAHGGGAGSTDGSTGGLGGTGSGAETHFDGGAGAAGSGGPGGSASNTQNSLTFDSSGTWACPEDYVPGSLQAYVWGAGGGGGAGGGSSGGGGAGGGGFNSGNPSVVAGNNYPVTVGVGGLGGTSGSSPKDSTDGGSSSFNGGHVATGGQRGDSGGHNGSGGTGTYSGGHGGYSSDGANKGSGGGGAASLSGAGGDGTPGHLGNAGGAGAAASGSIHGGGHGGAGGVAVTGSYGGVNGDATGGGGGGGYTDQFGASTSGGDGGRGQVQLFWYESGTAPDAAIGGGGGSSGGSASAGNDGASEAGGAAVAGGGPGGGTLSGSFDASPTATPGGGGGGYDSLGGPAAGAPGLLILSWAPSGPGSADTAANVMRFVLHVPAGGDTDGATVARMYTTGTIDYCDVIYNTTEQIVLGTTGVAASNPNPNPVDVTVTGGTVTEIAVNGVNTGQIAGVFTVPGNGTITVTYSAAPDTFSTAAVPGTGGSLTLTGFTGAGAQLFTTGKVAFGVEGPYVLVSVELTPSGSNVDYTLTGIIEGEPAVAATASGTLTGAVLGDPFDGVVNPSGELMSTSFAHLALQETGYDPIADLALPFAAYAGETAATRFARVCTENNIPHVFIDAPGYTDSTALVGPQLAVTVSQLLQDVEDADRGLLYEPRTSFGVAYRSRYSLYTQTPAVQLDYGQKQLANLLQPTDDDQLTRNDVTMSRPNGSSYEYAVTSGPLSNQDPPDGVGSYTYSESPNVYADSQLADIAAWTAFIGTVDELRYPVINLDLSRAEIQEQFESVASADIGDFVQIIDTADAPLPPGDVNQLMYGYAEIFGPFGIYTMAINAVPEDPYDIAVADDGSGNFARANTDGSALHSGIGTGDTQFYVDSPSPNAPWIANSDLFTDEFFDSFETSAPGWFPFDIVVNGERMTVNVINGNSTPQLFTVTRAVNGVQKAHNAGEPVNLFQIAYAAL